MSCTPHVPVIPSFPPSIFWCHSFGACRLLCLSRCASRLHVPAAPHCEQPGSGIIVMSCTPHAALILSFSPSNFQKHSCRAASSWTSQDNNTLQNKPQTHLRVTLNACTILDRTYQTCCSHSTSTTSLDGLTSWSGCLISLPSSQS